MTSLIRNGLLCATLAALPQFTFAQSMTAEEILQRLQSQREVLATTPEGQSRTLKFVDASKPAPAPADAAAVVSEKPADAAAASTAGVYSPASATAGGGQVTDAATGPATVSDAVATVAALPAELSIDLVVYFEFNSAILKPAAREQLDALCTALKTDTGTGTYQIIGHTDSSGTADYNLRLSKARAEEVVRYMVGTCGMAENRLQALGLGEERPKDPGSPRDSRNRRVEIQVAS